jgi:hypothetical protein
MKFRSIISLLFIFVSSNTFCQQIRLFSQEAFAGSFLPIDRTMNYSEIEGSPYLNDDLIEGYATFRLGDSAVHYLRYNIYSDEIEYLKGNQLYVIDNEEKLDRVYVDGHTFFFTPYSIRNSVKTGYLELLVSGKAKLYIKYNVDFEKAENAQSSYDKPKPPRFVNKLPQYFYSLYGAPIVDFNNDSGGLEVVGKDHYEQLKTYAKKEKLKLRKTEDLIQIFKYYNTLLE